MSERTFFRDYTITAPTFNYHIANKIIPFVSCQVFFYFSLKRDLSLFKIILIKLKKINRAKSVSGIIILYGKHLWFDKNVKIPPLPYHLPV